MCLVSSCSVPWIAPCRIQGSLKFSKSLFMIFSGTDIMLTHALDRHCHNCLLDEVDGNYSPKHIEEARFHDLVLYSNMVYMAQELLD